ncbi:NDR1/HIN1-like protein 1 [Phoenix dactylifera]|uniref:NDR1/HIN1-like protein 1 n=1 Tax=Phoenix dactylifera TaxID=42345 RepID=A0A8B8ZND6_PHODC|nr:NDR1/HIN1-like protein 1 [Phoenix dactylifera]XP_038972998.1 NDR1/HIN1-like protein 1 [Phoenix dactylifera]
MSGKDCGNHGGYWPCKRHKVFRRLFACFLCLIIVVLFAILVIWLVLRPSKPRFNLQDATVTNFNLAAPNLLSFTVQITIGSRNPNDRIGIYYDRLDVYADYKGQQITAATALPTGYQGHDDFSVWSPYLYGNNVPLAQYLAVAVDQDESAGFILIYFKIDGRLRWKVGTWISGNYHIDVNCPAFFTVNSTKEFQFQKTTSCSVDV